MPEEMKWMESPFPLVSTPQCREDVPDLFEKSAIEMTLVHNMILRGLNSIYKQALWIQPRDINSFLEYCNIWIHCITVHHAGEEEHLFPWIESAAGVPDLMSVNRAQHESFHDGLSMMQEHVTAGLHDTHAFDGAKLLEIIDGFGSPLREHLADEIVTLVDLRKHGDKLSAIQKMIDRDAQENMGRAGLSTGLVMILLLHDATWENGKWANFPPAPGVLLFAVRKLLYHIHSDWWRFAPCDNNARPQAQYAVPPQA